MLSNFTFFLSHSKCSKIHNTLLNLCSNKMLDVKAGIHNMLVRIANREDLIRLLLLKQSDLGLHCLSMPLFFQNFRTFTLCQIILKHLIF